MQRRCNGGATEVQRRCNGVGRHSEPARAGRNRPSQKTVVEGPFTNKPTQTAHLWACLRKYSQLWENLRWLDRFRPQVAGFGPPGDICVQSTSRRTFQGRDVSVTLAAAWAGPACALPPAFPWRLAGAQTFLSAWLAAPAHLGEQKSPCRQVGTTRDENSSFSGQCPRSF